MANPYAEFLFDIILPTVGGLLLVTSGKVIEAVEKIRKPAIDARIKLHEEREVKESKSQADFYRKHYDIWFNLQTEGRIISKLNYLKFNKRHFNVSVFACIDGDNLEMVFASTNEVLTFPKAHFDFKGSTLEGK